MNPMIAVKQAVNTAAASVSGRPLRRYLLVSLLTLAAGFGVFAVVQPALAWSISGFLASVVAFICEMLVKFLGQLLLLTVNVLIDVAQYNKFVTEPAVGNGWVIVRDVVNMFFILVLLIMAFATILGVESYSIKGGNLTRLLLMAVIINFSRTLCGLMIDLGQIIMLTFVSGFKEAAGGNFVEALGINEMLQQNEASAGGLSDGQIVVSWLLALFMTAISLFIVVMMTVALIIRIVFLWLLVVLSPIAFFMKAVPGGSATKFYAQWWQKFTSNVVVGPMYAFFLWLSLVSVQQGNLATSFDVSATGESMGAEAATPAFSLPSIQRFLISCCLLVGGYMMAQEVGGQTTGMASSFRRAATGAAKAAGRMGVRATVAAGRGVAGATGITAAYDRAKEGALSAATRIPLVRGAAAKALGKQRASMQARSKDAAGLMAGLNAGERAQFEKSWAISPEAKARKKEALRAGVKEMALKGPDRAKGETEDQYRERYFEKRRALSEAGSKQNDLTVASDLRDIEKDHPGLILDKNEKDPKVREDQANALRNVARRRTARQIGEMQGSDLTEQFLMQVDPAKLAQAAKEGNTEVQSKIRQFAGMTGGGDIDVAKLAQVQASEQKKRLGSLPKEERDKVAESMSKDDIAALGVAGIGNAAVFDSLMAANKGGDIADAIKPEELSKLPTEIGLKVKEAMLQSKSRTGETDLKLLQAGASVKEVYKSYDERTGYMDKDEDRQRFSSMIGKDPTKNTPELIIKQLPPEAMLTNGGANHMTIELLSRMDAGNMASLAQKDSGGAHTFAAMGAAKALGGMDDDGAKKAVENYERTLPMSMSKTDRTNAVGDFEKKLNSARNNAAKIVTASQEVNSPLRAEMDNWTVPGKKQKKWEEKTPGTEAYEAKEARKMEAVIRKGEANIKAEAEKEARLEEQATKEYEATEKEAAAKEARRQERIARTLARRTKKEG